MNLNKRGVAQEFQGEKPEEVNKLARGVNLCLDDGLGLSQHGGGVQVRPVLVRHLVGHLQEHLDLVVDGHSLPVLLGSQGGVDAELDQLRCGPVELGHLLLVVVRHDLWMGSC